MKIAIVLGAFFPVPPTMGGAVEKIWFSLAREFARRGHEVFLISRRLEHLPREEIREGVKHIRVTGFDAPASALLLKARDLVYSFRARAALPECDIVVTNTFWLPLLRRGVYVHVARYPKGQMRLYRTAARLQAPSRAVAQAIANEVPKRADRIIVIPYPAPSPSMTADPPPLDHRPKVILYVGRVHPEKGIHLLVEAFARVCTVFAEWKLMIVGPGEERLGGGGESYLRSLQRSAGDSVEFIGPVFDSAELDQHFRAARLFVYPSVAEHGESFGLAPLEAMTHGCAVLVSDLDCFRDFITDGETGFMFNHRVSDPARSLSDKMQHVLADDAIMARVADAGRRKSAEYAIDRVAGEFLKDFESVIKTHA